MSHTRRSWLWMLRRFGVWRTVGYWWMGWRFGWMTDEQFANFVQTEIRIQELADETARNLTGDDSR